MCSKIRAENCLTPNLFISINVSWTEWCYYWIFSLIFPTITLKRIPQTITKVSKYGAKPEDTTPTVLSLIWTVSVLKRVHLFMCLGLISVRRTYSKSYPSPSKSPLSLQCFAGSEVKKVCWFGYLKLTCLSAENVHLSSPQMSSKQWCFCVNTLT